jgi:hypothetical protein
VYDYTYDKVDRVMTADECRDFASQIFKWIFAKRSEDARQGIYDLLHDLQNAFSLGEDPNSALVNRFIHSQISTEVRKRAIAEFRSFWTHDYELFHEICSSPTPMTHVPSRPPVQNANISPSDLFKLAQLCATEPANIRSEMLKKLRLCTPLFQNGLDDALVQFIVSFPTSDIEVEARLTTMTPYYKDAWKVIHEFTKWRKLNPAVKTADLRNQMDQEHPEWIEFNSTHPKISEFITDPRMTQKNFKEGILYMIYVRKMEEAGKFKDANMAKKLVSERLQELFSVPLTASNERESYTEERIREDEEHQRKINEKEI